MGFKKYSIGTTTVYASSELATNALESNIANFLVTHGFVQNGSNYTRGPFKFTYSTNYSNRVEMKITGDKYSRSWTVYSKGSGNEYYYDPIDFYEVASANGLWYGFSVSNLLGSGHATNAITGLVESATSECGINLSSTNNFWADVTSSTNPSYSQNAVAPVCIGDKVYCFDGCLVSGQNYFKGYFGYAISVPDGYTLNNPYFWDSLLVVQSGTTLYVMLLPF